ncbi:MAG TPA: DUF721 domain-containing protein [Acidimicrobiales bacterium]|nr:DUF721 domain-containing protein [Acidimicrobiales bacterium]
MSWRPLPGPAGGREPRPVGESLGRIARHLGAPPPAALAELFDGWDELVGPAVAAHARPVRLARGTLVVVVDQPAWAAQLGWLEADLLRRFEERLGGGVVRAVTVRVRPR